MTIIYGESGTGKSSLAISQLINKKNSLYLSLDKDNTVIKELKKNNIDFSIMNNCHLLDIKYRLLENGGLINNSLEYVVIDSINFIKDEKKYSDKIKYIDEIAKDLNIKIVLIFNILKNMDKMKRFVDAIEGYKMVNINKVIVESHLPL